MSIKCNKFKYMFVEYKYMVIYEEVCFIENMFLCF